MPILESAKKQFLNRELESYNWVKKASTKELEQELKRLHPRPKFITKPRKHQKACFLLGVNLLKFLFLLDMGLGKTKLILDILKYLITVGEIKTALVLVPNLINIDGWVRQIKEHRPDLTYSALEGTRHERDVALLDPADVYIINYAGFVAMVTDLVKLPGTRKRKRVISDGLLKKFYDKFDAIILDESTAVKNWQTITYRACSKIANSCEVRFALTGTPFGRDPIDLWAQFYVIDRGETLGQTLGIFRECFFKPHMNYFTGFDDWTFDRKKEKKLNKVLKNCSIRYNEKECIDLPEAIPIDIVVSFPVDTHQYYKRIVDKVIKAKRNYQLMENSFVQMRQIASGFVGYKDENNVKAKLTFDDNPKLDALVQILEEAPTTSKIVIYHEFVFTGELISAKLKELGIRHVRIWGGAKNKSKVINQFLDDPECRHLVANHQSVSKGNNFQIANYVVFFESPVSPIDRVQAEKRCYRWGQNKTVFFMDIIMKNSVDEKIRRYLKEGKDLFQALIEGKEKWI